VAVRVPATRAVGRDARPRLCRACPRDSRLSLVEVRVAFRRQDFAVLPAPGGGPAPSEDLALLAEGRGARLSSHRLVSARHEACERLSVRQRSAAAKRRRGCVLGRAAVRTWCLVVRSHPPDDGSAPVDPPSWRGGSNPCGRDDTFANFTQRTATRLFLRTGVPRRQRLRYTRDSHRQSGVRVQTDEPAQRLSGERKRPTRLGRVEDRSPARAPRVSHGPPPRHAVCGDRRHASR
jgi:hypothetical protein